MQKTTIRLSANIRQELQLLSDKYETIDFLQGDPAWFMHQVIGEKNQETIAFIASCLSYGNRKAFFPKLQNILAFTNGEPYNWVKKGLFLNNIPDDTNSFYRLYSNKMMRNFLASLQKMLIKHNSIKEYIQQYSKTKTTISPHKIDTILAVEALCQYFSAQGFMGIVPKDTSSSCKRVCMFLRWMVRDHSPVDIGIWGDFIDKKTLIIPLDTHVLQQSMRLGINKSKTTSMTTARNITAQLRKVFPNDPLKGDFALFGYGINAK